MRRSTRRVLLPLLLAGVGAGCAPPPRATRTGLEVLAAEGFRSLRGRKVAVLTNPTGVDRSLESTIDLVARAPGVELVAILGPEHGARGAAAAGEEVAHGRDARTGVPVYSLYGSARRPSIAMLEGADTVLFDIQDIGVRTYTYLATLVRVLESAREHAVEVWVLDRPVPIGGDRVEGPVLEPELESFVGPHAVPLRHGLTAGEFARMVCDERGIDAKLRVVAMQGYRRDELYGEDGRIWVAPSPNIPDPETALVYAGTVLVEGMANLSEGRGTTRPFRLIGAPWLDGTRLARELNRQGLAGALFREAWFTPEASKYRGEECSGIEIHVTDPRVYEPVTAAVVLLAAIGRLHPGELRFREDAFDRLAGTRSLRRALLEGRSAGEIVAGWKAALEAYAVRRERYLLYE